MQLDAHAGLAGLVEPGNHGFVLQGIHFENDVGFVPFLGLLDFVVNQLVEAGTQAEGGYQQVLQLGRLRRWVEQVARTRQRPRGSGAHRP